MIKTFCNMCGAELPKDKRYSVRMSVRMLCTDISADYCGHCLSVVLGKETFEDMHKRKAEREKRAEERRKVRVEK